MGATINPNSVTRFSVVLYALLTLDEATELMQPTQRRHVLELAEEGGLRALNIASTDSARQEMRFYRYSVQWLLESERSGLVAPTHPPVEALLPHHRANFLLREVADFLRCHISHVEHLRSKGILNGPQFSERENRVSRTELIRFLQTREVNALN